MTSSPTSLRRVLIVSANPLFREGLRRVYAEKWQGRAEIVATPTSMEDARAAILYYRPDLVIVDYDDKTINRAEFMEHFVSEEAPMQVMLVSLAESGEVLLYNRKRLTPAQAEHWNPWPE
ncbi:response regulator transcription factor [bacterium]|nr:response regulator transcription factor [bacterium]NCT20104.1 response regulator transcription factor [bacterium]